MRTPYIDLLVQRLAAAPDAVVLRHRGRDVRAGDLLDDIHRAARALQSVGIGRRDIVALFAENRPDALAVRYGAHVIGAAAMFLPAPPEAAVRAAMIAEVDPQLLVVFPTTADLVPDGVRVPVAAVGCDLARALPLDAIMAVTSPEPRPCRARPDDLAVLIASGGTTGVPKASWRNMAVYTAMVDVPSPADRRQLVNGSLAHLSQVLVDETLLGGGTVVLRDRVDPLDTLRTIEAERITDLFVVEPQLEELVDHPALADHDLTSLRQLVHIGASAPATLRRRARRWLGPVIAHAYGASEMGIVSALPPDALDATRPATFTSAGHVVPGVEVRLLSPTGGVAPVGRPGIIEVRSPALAGGYRNRPADEPAFHDGWFRSGDLGVFDDDGLLHILGRAADIEVVGDALVTPTAIEDTLCGLPSVRYAVVVDDDTGRRVAAVLAWPGADVCLPSVHRTVAVEHGHGVAASLAVVTVDRIPLTEQGKPDRQAILALVGTAAVAA